MANILVVDDHKAQRKNLTFYLKSQGYNTENAESAEEALTKLESARFDIVITDHKVTLDGLKLLRKSRSIKLAPEFIVVSGYCTVPMAVEFMRDGVADILTRPVEFAAIHSSIEKIIKRHGAKPAVCGKDDIQIICHSRIMKDIADLADRASLSDITMLIEGETGTGKELFARYVHQKGQRSGAKFRVLECSSANENELEAALFGSIDPANDGLLSECNGGTLMIRDIDSIGPKMQVRLLRFLREGIYAPADSASYRKSDVRVIASTSKSLKALAVSGNFREDLYYLLNIMPVRIPPLHQRTDDIHELVRYFIGRNNARLKKNIKDITPEVLTWMKSYQWPGNVRELENIIARSCVLADSDIIDESLIFSLPQDRPSETGDNIGLNITLKDNQRTLILKALKQNSGNFSRTATQLGISRTTLWRRMKGMKIEGLPVDHI